MPTTLKDVARKANVSYQTVWRAVHDRPGILPSTRESILRLASKLGYRPNRVAGSLRTKRSHTIGLVVYDVSNVYTAQLISGIEAEAARHGFSVLLISSGNEFEREREAVFSLLERGVDGLILSAANHGDRRYLRAGLPKGFPFVAINHAIAGLSAVTVSARNREAARTAAMHLLGQGHTEIAGLFGGLANPSVRERHDGFADTVRDAGLSVHRDWIRTGANSVAFARETVQEMFASSPRPTALFASTHQLTEGALLGLHDLGLRRGKDVAVVGFDIRYAQLLDPPLPVLVQPAVEMGECASHVLIQQIKREGKPKSRKFPVEFQK
jgi:LacI family transcriptional regulator